MKTLTPDHHLVVADRGRLRIYRIVQEVGQRKPGLTNVLSLDFPSGRKAYHEQETDQAGRFPGNDGRSGGMSIDERLPLQQEQERQLVDQVAAQINRHFKEHPKVAWNFSAAPDFGRVLLTRLDPDVRARLAFSMSKDLAGEAPAKLLAHFTA